VSESAASAKRLWFMFGAKPAQSETPVRARGQAGVHPEEAQWKKDAKLLRAVGVLAGKDENRDSPSAI